MPLATAQGLVKAYTDGRSERRILDGVDLAVEPGELVAIVGPSGSGKSTLLHLLGGLDSADAGWIEVAGRRLDGADQRTLTELRRDAIGFVFQFFHLIPELTGEENVLLPTRIGPDGKVASQRARVLIGELGLSEVSGRRPHLLSGGEQQRLAIARAMARDPALILADEPTGNLDATSAEQVLALLRRFAAGNRAVIVATHDPAATRLADRVLTVRDGRLSP